MTGGFLSVPIMRPNHCWTILHVSILAMLLLTLNADSEDSKCEVEIRVRRNTVYEAFLGDDLRINCTVLFCNNSPPATYWYKLEKTNVNVNVSGSSHIKTEWKTLNHVEGISYLIFQNILTNDSGVYRCRSGHSVSHSINISVDVGERDDEHTNVTQKNSTDSGPTSPENLWMYIYTAAGIVAFVIIVIIISVASMQGCKGKSKKEMQTENQYMAIPMGVQPFPHASLQPSARGSPSAPPSRRSTRRKTPPLQPNEMPLPRDNECLYSKIKGDRERQRNTVEEEGGSVVYAALNHQLPAGAAARTRRPHEESSEYASIRVKDPTPTRH
ncbi:B- and T-lymphocyte attenuator-like isoform X5 [Siniperca chuatsi]|uniref:B- and T-lymphocyte attenuator-like isoform X5 n=1 Tax=Siniperca chuatsi TaxID=119488 RepID=UPI001CE0CB81|nr:B- and T-lymphocyte attenuator-like isoform X5 [Siniperca chuatsi]